MVNCFDNNGISIYNITVSFHNFAVNILLRHIFIIIVQNKNRPFAQNVILISYAPGGINIRKNYFSLPMSL